MNVHAVGIDPITETSLSTPHDTSDDGRRRERVEAYSILDTPRETSFDRYVFTVAQLFRTPFAAISILDADRHWFKARVGIPFEASPRPDPLLDEALGGNVAFTVEDASGDGRFGESGFLQAVPRLRFFAAAPLIAPDGVRVGCMVIGDVQSKSLTARQLGQLDQLAHSVVATLEARRIGA